MTIVMPAMDKLERKGIYKAIPMKIISFVQARMLVGKEFSVFLAYL